MKLPAYPRTKPSGVEWLGDVPEHWEVKPLKRAVRRSVSGGELIKGEMAAEPGEGLFQGFSASGPDVWVDEAHYSEPGVVLSAVGARCGKAFKADGQWTAVANTHVFFPAEGRSRHYLWYLLNNEDFWEKGGTAQPYVRVPATLNRAFVFAPPAEQRAIGAYLDRETGRLDRLVGRKRELIERLKEKRTARISRTVTRGLPPAAARAAGFPENPPLKPSGVEWLGELPVHWQAAQLRRKAQILDCKHRTVPFIDDGIPLASIREVHGFEVDLTDAKQTSEEEYLALIEGDRRPRVGNIIYSRNATVGDAALVTTKERFCMGQDVCLIRAPKHHPKYLLYLFRSAPLMEQVESLMIGSTFRRINVGQIHGFWICVPPLPEQTAIAAYLDEETAKLDALVAKVEAAVERLQEYRTALITAAVTGKIDVRNATVSG